MAGGLLGFHEKGMHVCVYVYMYMCVFENCFQVAGGLLGFHEEGMHVYVYVYMYVCVCMKTVFKWQQYVYVWRLYVCM